MQHFVSSTCDRVQRAAIRWWVSAILLMAGVGVTAGIGPGPADPNWASHSSPVQMGYLLTGGRTIYFDPTQGASIPQTRCLIESVTVEQGQVQVQVNVGITVTMTGNSDPAIAIVKVVLQDTADARNRGSRYYYFFRDDPTIVMTDDIVTHGTAGPFSLFSKDVTQNATYERVGGGLVHYVFKQPTIAHYELVSKPAGSQCVPQVVQCQPVRFPLVGGQQCKSLSLLTDRVGTYIVRFTLSDINVADSEGYWCYWVHHAHGTSY